MTLPTACPSSACRPGASLIGIVLPSGQVAFASDRIVIDAEFVRVAHEGRSPEQRFRFSSPCMQAKCRQWTGQECGLIDRLLVEFAAQCGPIPADTPLPSCPIRSECRWFLQRAGEACAVCTHLVTDIDLADHELPAEVQARRATIARADAPLPREKRIPSLVSVIHPLRVKPADVFP